MKVFYDVKGGIWGWVEMKYSLKLKLENKCFLVCFFWCKERSEMGWEKIVEDIIFV